MSIELCLSILILDSGRVILGKLFFPMYNVFNKCDWPCLYGWNSVDDACNILNSVFNVLSGIRCLSAKNSVSA